MHSGNTTSTQWTTAATVAAGLCLLVAPYRSTTGWRAGLLVLAILFIGFAAIARRDVCWALPRPSRTLYIIGAWATALLMACLISADRWHQVNSWKAEIFTPLLSLFVFFALTKTLNDIRRWLVLLFLGLIGLTYLVILNAIDPIGVVAMPAFGGVGPYSTWLVTLCSLLPIAWHLEISQAKSSKRSFAKKIVPLAILLILVSAFLTTNRAIWGCFALMLIVFVAVSTALSGREGRRVAQMVSLLIVGSTLFAVLFLVTTELRFDGKPPGGGGAVEMITQDNRGAVWREASNLIVEKPLTGYGYGRDKLEKIMSARFTEPLDKALFIQGHNIVLNQILQIGALGGILILAVFVSLTYTFANMLRGAGPIKLVGICGLLLMTGVFSRNMVDDFFIRQNAILFWAIVGMLLGLGSAAADSQSSSSPKLQNDGPKKFFTVRSFTLLRVFHKAKYT
jgi:O-antigen ligase